MTSPFRLIPYESNPVVPMPGPDGGAMLPHVMSFDGVLHMWFTQSEDWLKAPAVILHAVSTDDGETWEVDPEPALVGDGNGFDAFAVGEPVVVATDSGLVMYYNGRGVPGPGPGPHIGRAVSESPSGPWSPDPDPVLTVGAPGDWDSGFVTPNAALVEESGTKLIYSGGTDYVALEATHLGLAESADGVEFAKHAEPVMSGEAGWDGHFNWEAAVFPYNGGLGAFYTGDPKTLTGEAIGFAWSPDGMTWTKAEDNPLLEPRQQEWATLDVVAGSVVTTADGRMLLFYSGNRGQTQFRLDFAIGMAELVPTD